MTSAPVATGAMLAVFLVAAAAQAETVQVCRLPGMNALRMQAIVAAHLGRRVSFGEMEVCPEHQISVVIGDSDVARPPHVFDIPEDIDAQARERYVALLIAEMLRHGAGTAPTLGEATRPAAAGLASPQASVWSVGTRDARLDDERPPIFREPEPEPEPPDRVQFAAAVGSRMFLSGPFTATWSPELAVHWRRLGIFLNVHGARTRVSAGSVSALLVTLGAGVRVAEVSLGEVEVSLRLRGEVGYGTSSANTNTVGVVAVDDSTAVAGALVDVPVMLPLGEVMQWGLVFSTGVQQGFRTVGDPALDASTALLNFHGLFLGAHLSLGGRP